MGVDNARVLHELWGAEVEATVMELLGVEVGDLTLEERAYLEQVARRAEEMARVEKRIRSSESHLDDEAAVLKAARSAVPVSSSASAKPPLPGLRAGMKRVGGRGRGGTGSLAEQDRVLRDRWNERLGAALVRVNAPTVQDCLGRGDLKQTVEMLVGRARPGTVRLRVRSWEAFGRWLEIGRGRTWPADARDLTDYVKDMVSLPAPRSFPAQFGGAVAWFMSRTGRGDWEDLSGDYVFRRALDWAEVELADVGQETKKAPRLPVLVLIALELKVLDGEAPLVIRVVAWIRLIKVYGGLRWDDLQRLAPRDLEMRVSGLVGRLTRTKVSGAGRRVKELPLFIPREAYLTNKDWLEAGIGLFRGIGDPDRDYFLPRPTPSMEDFTGKVATTIDAAAMSVALLSSLRVPIKVGGEAGRGSWVGSAVQLLPGVLAGGWTNHSERSTLTSALAAIGVGKDHRNLIGRWSPDGSDDYVRTYRAAVKNLIMSFIGTVHSGRSYLAFDEEDAYVQVGKRVVESAGAPEAVEAAIADLKALAEDASKDMAVDVELASPTEVATLSPPGLEAGPGEEETEAKYIIVYTRGRKCARLHSVGGCWRARQMEFADYEMIEEDLPDRSKYNAVCRGCWPLPHAVSTGGGGEPDSEDDSASSTTESGEDS